MKFTPLSIPGVVLVERDVYADDRGFFSEIFHGQKYEAGGIKKTFVQDNLSHSKQGVLRGLHYQRKNPQGKLVFPIRGEIFDVAVDMRRGSPTFGKWVGHILSNQNRLQLYVPEGCAHGFCVMSEETDVMYKCTTYYVPEDDQGIIWNDPTFNIAWPTTNPVLSPKDKQLPKFKDLAESILPPYFT